MENSDKDEDDKVTLLDIKELKSLSALLIDTLNDFTTDKEFIKINF